MGDEFNSFYSEVKSIEKADSIYKSEHQINRLLRPGSTYANLNPFEVLLVDPNDSIDQAKKQYRKLSILLHPDKNPNDRERAQKAFDALNKAYKILEDEKSREKALEVVEEAKFKVKQTMDEKRRKLRLENRKDPKIDEDDPEKYKQSLRTMTMKLFAEYERKRRLLEDRAQEERKRKREEELEEVKAKEIQQEWQKNFEESRQNRVQSWHSFSKKTKNKARKDIRPPKHKAEARN
ncbi:hypothetical protein RDWZM_006914 [Blomia tropicalis]|uniref:J domain-containing protein n=1 Tax=Blomia tropicalis TaxID=40697 RepID=A0A9Q0MBE8_BLOTA|nr:DnaJ (Hsp40), sub C, member 8 [Blomia tropicalis]KAJ6221102.1 hypothetical protein RDWZM_006914 [Blomia tropicalis]